VSVLTSFPTVIFTGFFAFCLAWWLISMLFGALDLDLDGDGDADADGFGHHVSNVLGASAVPIPLALTILAFGAWASSLVLHVVVSSSDESHLDLGVALLVLAGATVVGLVLLRLLARPLRSLFHTERALERRAAVGSVCKVRTLTVGDNGGQAEVVSGGLRGNLIPVTAGMGGPFHRGDHALIVDYDDTSGRYTITDIDDDLLPDR
jgi:hypothetical protein